jgi:hypothetical protein
VCPNLTRAPCVPGATSTYKLAYDMFCFSIHNSRYFCCKHTQLKYMKNHKIKNKDNVQTLDYRVIPTQCFCTSMKKYTHCEIQGPIASGGFSVKRTRSTNEQTKAWFLHFLNFHCIFYRYKYNFPCLFVNCFVMC